MKVVILQPQFFPWVGCFEQIRLADIYMHYDDAPMPKSLHYKKNFLSRVQIKTPGGPHWLTAPVIHGARLIRDARIDNSQSWKRKHLKTLQQNYARAPFGREMLEIVESVYSENIDTLADLDILSIEKVSKYFSIDTKFVRSSNYQVNASSTEKVLQLVQKVGGSLYITGHGALNYFDHDLLERNDIRVEYIDYKRTPYPQLHGAFDPHVSILDLIANTGKKGIKYIHSSSIPWKTFVALQKSA